MTAAVIVFAVLLSAWSAALAVLGEREKTRETARKCDFITALVGVVILIVGIIVSQCKISRLTDRTTVEDLSEMLRACYGIAFIVTGVLFVVCAVTSLMSIANPKLRGGFSHKIRVTMIAVSAVFVFSLALIGYIATSAYVGWAVFVSTAGLGLMMRFCSLIENQKGKQNEK